MTEPLYARLPLEVQFIAHVGELNAEQAAALDRSGRNAIEAIAAKIAPVIKQNNAALGLQAGQNFGVVKMSRVGDEELVRTPHLWMRRELSEALQAPARKLNALGAEADAWRTNWKRFGAERARIEERRAGAATWAYLAALDDALLLSDRQRTDLREAIAQHARDGWWQPTHTGGKLHTALETLLSSVAGESLGGFMVPGSDLTKRLTAPQLATLSDLEHPQTELLIAQQVAAQPAAGAPEAVPAQA